MLVQVPRALSYQKMARERVKGWSEVGNVGSVRSQKLGKLARGASEKEDRGRSLGRTNEENSRLLLIEEKTKAELEGSVKVGGEGRISLRSRS
jgi:hypothetical protein